jgi:glucosamine--fructose-6-phosphate aminotransferase (isomerizing)
VCGIFGYVSKTGKGPDIQILKVLAKVTESRGPHAFGFAWIDGRGRLRAFKQQGRISCVLGILDMMQDARLLIGHCRYATHGSPESNINNHPHPCDGGWLVHNGVIRNYVDLMVEHEFDPVSECDSEVLAMLIENSANKSHILRCVDAVDRVEVGPLAMLGLWPTASGGRLIACKRGNPLHVGLTANSVYIASLPKGLPGKVHSVEEGRVIEYRRTKDGGIKHVAASVLVG